MTSQLTITTLPTKHSRLAETDFEKLGFGKIFSDHMFYADYHQNEWKSASIVPYEGVLMSPATSALHYGQAIFEGMKAYKNEKGEIYLFRPLDNFRRLNKSAIRMAMPEVPEEIFMEGLKQLILLDKNWVPTFKGASLYIRPFIIGTDEYIGVKPSDDYRFFIITSPGGAYYSEPLKVKVETSFIRAVEGGVGFVKASGNYGRSLYPTRLAQQLGYHQIIWTDAREHKYLEESGTMNLMFVIDGAIVTPPLGDTILAGITRDSVLTLARDWGIRVEERKISIDEIIEAQKKGILQEAFGTGTAATIAQISLIGYKGTDYSMPPIEERKFSLKVAEELDNIRKGISPDKHGWMHRII
jgi:branched-chain amino acid aminotransferase